MNIRESLARILYPDVFNELNKSMESIHDLNVGISQLNNAVESLKDCPSERDKLKTQLENLKNISPFETYLDAKFPTGTFVYTKRWIKGAPVPMDIRDFIQEDWTLPTLKTLGEIFMTRINYVTDSFAYNGILDWWQVPQETFALAGGDCEDSATLRASLALRAGIKNVFCALGMWNGVGHCFNIYMNEEGNIYILENTINKYAPLPLLKDKLKDTGTGYKINYIFNKNKVWIVDGSTVFGVPVQKEFNIRKVRK
jgi:predicted transglutaminase-like cysteine proteinase